VAKAIINNGLVRVEVWGEEKVEAEMGALIEHSADLAPAYAAVGEAMRAYEVDLFDSEGAISGEPWQPLSPETRRTKAQKGYPSDIEIATGELRDSLVDINHPDHIEEITPEFLRFGSEQENAARQQYGTDRMPARPILNFREVDVEGFTRIISHYIRHGIVESSLASL
jgi:hypothetical protein